jgi:hypothetical protein
MSQRGEGKLITGILLPQKVQIFDKECNEGESD